MKRGQLLLVAFGYWVLLALAVTFALISPADAQQRIEGKERPAAMQGAPIVVQLDGIPTSSLVTMLLRDIMRVPYVITPDVLADRRPTSVRLVIPRGQVPQHVVTYLRRSGYSVSLVGGTVYVGRAGNRGAAASPAGVSSGGYAPTVSDSSVPMGSPVALNGYKSSRDLMAGPVEQPASPPIASQPPQDMAAPAAAPGTISGVAPVPSMPSGIVPSFVAFLPAHRDTAYLAQMLSDVVPGLKFGAAGQVKADTAALDIQPRTSPDVLIATGSVTDLAVARQLLPVLDRPRPMVSVKAAVMSVSETANRGSALNLLASVAGRRVSIGSFAGEAAGGQFVRIASGAFSAVLSAVRDDSRFKVVATPNLAALSGAVASMNSGSQVPVVSSVSIAEGGTPVQSIEYRDSGITLTVRPVVRGDLIELDVKEERSTFVRTTTGVSNTPTLQRSAASASVVLKSGESVVLAGLTEESAGTTSRGLLGGLLGVRGREKSSSQLVVMLTAEVVAAPATAPGVFLDLDPEPQPPSEGDELAPKEEAEADA